MVNRTQHKRRSVKKTRAHRRKPHAHRRKPHARRRKTRAHRRKTHAHWRKTHAGGVNSERMGIRGHLTREDEKIAREVGKWDWNPNLTAEQAEKNYNEKKRNMQLEKMTKQLGTDGTRYYRSKNSSGYTPNDPEKEAASEEP